MFIKRKLLFLLLYFALPCFDILLASNDQFSVLIKNKIAVADNNIHNVTYVSVPFSGHFNILMKSALNQAKSKQFNITFIVTGWENITVSTQNLNDLTQAGIQVHVLNDKPLASPAPMTFTFPRVINLVDKTIEYVKGSDLIIYDFFALEGFFAGKQLNIPTICSIPAIVGPFNPHNKQYLAGIQQNISLINQLEKKFDIEFVNNLEMVSDAFLLPSESENIIWSWSELIKASDFQSHRNLKNITFIRPEAKVKSGNFKIELEQGQKLIYVSFGTVVTKNLWNNVPAVHEFVASIFNELVKSLGNNKEYVVVISTGREPSEVIQNPPSNFHVFESVPQEAVLEKADLFITHGGGNSINEAIDLEVPMVVIPFFGDQHLSALDVQNLKIGISFLHPVTDQEAAINTESGLFARASLNPMSNLIKAITCVLQDKTFKDNLKKMKQNKPEEESSIVTKNFLFKWREGDLLFGINTDRIAFTKKMGLEEYFKIGDIRPFSKLFSSVCYINALPKLVDQYNDVLRSPEFKTEVENEKFIKYKKYLKEYHEFLVSSPAYLQPLGRYPGDIPAGDSPALETLWNMCLGGLHFFLSKDVTIHFIVKDYDSRINKATTKEIEWIRSKWHDNEIKRNVKFYLMGSDTIEIVDPEKFNWFQK